MKSETCKQFHILNGDALKQQFPSTIAGELIVARECFVDGPVSANTVNELYSIRANFLNEDFPEINKKSYYQKTVSEFEKIQIIPENSEVNLWFEDDLFCQVNLWFVIHLLKTNKKNYSLFLVRPNKGNEYSFGNMRNLEIKEAFRKRQLVNPSELKTLSKLWGLYQRDELKK